MGDPILGKLLNSKPVVKEEIKAPSTILDSALKFSSDGHAGDIQLGQFGVGESKYDTNVTPENVSQLEEIRAQKQSSAAKLGSGLINTIVQTPLDIIKDASYLLDVENYTNFKEASEEGFHNWLADAIQSAEDKLKLPVYRTQASEGFSPLSAGWWGENLPSMASTVSMAIPAQGVVMGLSKLGKLVGGEKIVKGIEGLTGVKGLADTAKGVGAAVVSRQMEAIMEGGQTYEDTFRQAIESGKSEEEARVIAGEAAANNYKLNWAALVQDIPEYLFLNKAFKESSKAFTLKGAKEAAKIGLIEGSEEAYQFITDKESSRDALIKGDVIKDDNRSFGDRMVEYAQDGDFWTSAFLGAIGGAGFGLYGVHKDNKNQQSFNALLEAHKGIITGDPNTYYRAQDQLVNDKITSSIADGQLEGFKEGVKAILSNPERIKDEDKGEVSKRLNNALDQIEYAENIGKDILNDKTLTPELKKAVFQTKLEQRAAENRLQEINTTLLPLQSKDYSLLNVTPDVLAYKEAKLTLEGIKTIPNLAKQAKGLQSRVIEVSKEIVKAYPDKYKSIDDLNKSIISSHDEEMKKLLTNKSIENEILAGAKELIYLKDTDAGKKDLQEKVEKAKEKRIKEEKAEQAKQLKEDVTNFASKIAQQTEPQAFTPEEQQFYENNKKAIEKELQALAEAKESAVPTEVVPEGQSIDLTTGKPSKITETTWEGIDESKVEERFSYYTEESKRALTPFKTNNGVDDDFKEAEARAYRYVEKLKLDGHKLKIVTKNNNPELFKKIIEDNPTAKDFEKNNPKHPSIWTVLVDKDGNIVRDNDKLIAFTLETDSRIEREEILVKDKDEAINALNKLRGDILKEASPDIYLPITSKSKGIPEFLPTIEGKRQSITVEQAFGPLDKVDLQLPTQRIGDSKLGWTKLKNDQTALVGKLYIFDENGRAFDLIPRNVNQEETELIIRLLAQRLGAVDQTVNNPSKEIEKIIFFGIPKDGVNRYTIGVKDGVLHLGEDVTLTADEFMTEEGLTAVRNFLATKRVNVSKEYGFNDSFVAPRTDDNQEAVKYNTYKEYLLGGETPMFGTDLKPKSEVQYRNMYLIYEPTVKKDELPKVEEPKEEIEEVDDKLASPPVEDEELNKIFKKKGNTSRKIDLDRLESIISTPKTKLSIAEENWFKSNFPNIELNKVRGLIEQQSFGRFISSGKVLLSDLAPDNTLRHEAFHVVTQLYLTQEEIKKLYKEARKKIEVDNPFPDSIYTKTVYHGTDNPNITEFKKELMGSKNQGSGFNFTEEREYAETYGKYVYEVKLDIRNWVKTDKEAKDSKLSGINDIDEIVVYNPEQIHIINKSDLQIEELLAEDFANYKDTNQVLGNQPVRNTLFRRILNFIKNLLNLPVTSIQQIYERIDKGYYVNKPMVYNRQFSSLDSQLPGISVTQTKEILDGMDAVFFDIIFENAKTPNQAFNNTGRVLDIIYNEFVDRQEKIKELNDSKSTDQRVATLKAYNYILSNWDVIKDVWEARMRSFGVDVQLEEEVDPNVEQSVVDDENKTDRSGEAYQETNTIATKSTLSNATKLLIRSLKQKNPDGSDKLNSLGLPQTVDFNKTYNYLLNRLSGIGQDYTDIYEKIKELSKTKPELVELVNRIGAPSPNNSLEQQVFQMEFRQDFDKNKVDSHTTMLKVDGTIYVINANTQATSDRVKEQWRSNLVDLAVQDKEGKLVIDEKVLSIKDDVQFLQELGINFSPFTRLQLKNNEGFGNAVLGIRNYIDKNKGDVSNLYTDKSDVKGNIATLTELEAEFNEDINELSYMSSEGKTVYSIGLNNMLSIIKNTINNAKTLSELYNKLPHLETVTTFNSVYLNTLFDSNGNKREGIELILDLHDGLRTQDSSQEVKKSTRKLSQGDKFVQEINNILLHGRSSYIRASDKSTEHTISLNKYGKNQKLIIPIEDLKTDFNLPEIKDIFRGYFTDELNRIAQFEINGLGKDIDIYNKTGSKWTIFESMELPKKEIEAKIMALKGQNLSFPELSEELYTIAQEHYKDVDGAIIKFLNGYTKELTNRLEEFKINHELGLSKELTNKYGYDQLIRAVAVNDFINSIEQTKIFIGDMAFYKDLFKRTSGASGSKQSSAISYDINEWLNNNNKRLDKKVADDKINVVVFNDSTQQSNYHKEYLDSLLEADISQEVAEKLLAPYLKMDEGDAQGWITLDESREFRLRRGSWGVKEEKAWEKSQRGEELTSDELVYFLVDKAQYFGPQEYNNLFAPAYHKFSLMPLIPQLVKGKNLEKLLSQMTKEQIGYALFKSGSKVGTIVDDKGKATNFYTKVNSGEINTADWQKQVVYYQFLGLQTKTSEPKSEVIFGTQFRKLLFSNLFSQGKSVLKDNNIQQLKDEYNSIISDMVLTEKFALIKELGLNPETYKSEDVTKLVEVLREEAKSRDLPDNIIEALKTEEVNGKLMLKYKFDAMVNKAKIDSMLMSLVNSRLIRQKINGDSLVQGASSGFEKLGVREAGTNPALKFYSKDKSTGKTTPMQVRIPLTKQYRGLLDTYKTLEGVNQALKDGKIDKKYITLIGYRIPTQGLNSIDFMEIEEFLPETTSMIVLPTEIVAKSGGDYDIDKMNIFRYTINAKSKEANQQNRIIEIAKEILENPYNFNSLITPNSTGILTSVVDELRYLEFKNRNPQSKVDIEEYTSKQKSELSNIRYTNQLKLTTKVDQFNKFMLAKDMIGIAAIQNTHHILAQTENLTLNKEYLDSEGVTKKVEIHFPHHETKDNTIDLAQLKDAKGENYISEVISQVINATVDAAKDPFLFELNMNMETLATYLYLIRIGVPFENVAYFMKQPIITEYLKELSINKSAFLVAGKKKVNTKELINRVRSGYRSRVKEDLSKTAPKFFDKIEDLRSLLQVENQNSEVFFQTQVQVLDNFLAYKEQAQMLSDAIKAVNHDTAGLGKNIGSSHLKEKQEELVRKTNFVNGVDRLLLNTFIGSMDQNRFAIDAYGPFYYTQNEAIENNTQTLLAVINPFTDENKHKLRTLIENDFINYVVQNYGYNNVEELKTNLFKGTESVAKRLLELKNKPNKNVEEKRIADNMLVKELYPLLNKVAGQDNIKIYAKRYDTFTANQLTEAFRELKDVAPDLAKDIMDVGIIQSGLNNSPITYLGVIPYEYYNDIVKEAFDTYQGDDFREFNQLFLRNNTKEALVKRTSKGFDLLEHSLGNGIYGKDYDKFKYNSELPTIEPNVVLKTTEAVEDEEYIPEDVEANDEEIEGEAPQYKKRDSLEQRLVDSGYMSRNKGQLFIKQNFFAQATNLINSINKELGSLAITKEKLNHFGNGGRQIWKVIVNQSPEIQFNNTKDNNLSEAAFKEIADKLSAKTGVEYSIVSPEEAFRLLAEIGFDVQQTPVYQVPAFYYNNQVIIPDNYLTAETAFHEFAHPFVDAILRDNKALFARLKRELQDSESGQAIIKQVKKDYKELTNKQGELSDKGWKEAITTSLGKLADKQLSESKDKGLIASLKALLTRIGEYLSSLFSDPNKVIKPIEITPTTTLAELASMLNIENKIDLKIPKDSNIVNYDLKSVEFLSTEKATQLFNKFFNSNKDKFYQELTANVGKDQTELIKDIINAGEVSNIGDIMTSLLANNSYTVEINTAKHPKGSYDNEDIDNFDPEYRESKGNLENKPTQYYSNLTVPGGTNYTENEIKTPLITPSIKGHAQFSTDQGIGWFRSDDRKQEDKNKLINSDLPDGFEGIVGIDRKGNGITEKTRRILEVQSDLFQKGRDNKDLIGNSEGYKEGELEMVDLNSKPSNDTQNKFLQLLNKDNNWISFFIKSIIQDSAKKGYEKVLFPKGETAAKVEGHETLANQLVKINKELEYYKDIESEETKRFFKSKNFGGLDEAMSHMTDLEDERDNLKSQGIEKLKPIEAFYEVRVGNILKKNYDTKVVTDEYGNDWYEVEASNVDIQLRKRDVEPKKESAFTKQEIFFEKRLKTLNKRLKESKEGTERHTKTLEEIESLQDKFATAKTDSSRDLFIELGNSTLDKVGEFIDELEAGTARDTDENIRHTIDVLNTWMEFTGLRDKSAALFSRIVPFINQSTLEEVNKYATEAEPITQEDIDNQNTDIRWFKKSTGSLSDSSNYIARTIGSIIKSAQNRVETQNKQVASSIQTEVDELAKYAKKNGASLDSVYKIFIQEHRGTTVLAKEYLSGGIENANWTKIQETPELKRFYDFYQESINNSMENLPFIGIGGNKNFIPNIKKSDLKTKLKRLTGVRTRTVGEGFEEENLPDVVALEYNKPISASEKSNDLGAVLLQFSMFSNNYTEMSNVLPKVRILEEQLKYKIVDGQIKDREFKKASNPNLTVKGEDSNIAKMVSDIINMQVLGNMKMEQGVITISNYTDENGKERQKTFNGSEFADNLLRYNSLLRIGLSPITAVTNILFGDISNVIEAVGGRFMTVKGLHQATNIFRSQTFKKDSILNKLLVDLNPLQELDDYELLEKVKLTGKAAKMSPEKIMEYMYAPQKKGEKFLQARTMLAVMIKDGYLTSDGQLTDKYNNASEQEKQQLSDKVQRLNQKIHGRYTTKEAAALSQNVLYRLVSQFRKWIPSAVENRIGSKQYDNRLQGEIEGIYLTFGRLVLKNWRSPKEAFENLLLPLVASKKLLESGKMTESEIYNMRRMLTEILTASALILLYAGLHGGDDDEDKEFRKNPWVKTGLTLLNRASGDLTFFYSPSQLNNLGKNAMPLSKTIGDILQAAFIIPTAIYNDDYVVKKGSSKGRWRIGKEFSDITPLAKPLSDIARIASDQPLEELQ